MPSKAVIFASASFLGGFAYLGATHLSHPGRTAARVQALELAKQDAEIRLAHAKELLGDRNFIVATDGSRTVDISHAIEVLLRRRLSPKLAAIAPHVAHTIIKESRHYRLDPVFLLAVIERESQFSPSKIGQHGEIGLMQIRPSTAAWICRKYHLAWRKDALFNPITNIRIGAAYFSFLRKKFRSQGALYLAAYNLGPRKTRQSLENKVVPKIYAAGVMRNYLQLHTQLTHIAMLEVP